MAAIVDALPVGTYVVSVVSPKTGARIPTRLGSRPETPDPNRDRASAGTAKAASPQGAFRLGLGNWLDSGNPLKAGLAAMALLAMGAAVAFFGSLIVAAFRARRALQL